MRQSIHRMQKNRGLAATSLVAFILFIPALANAQSGSRQSSSRPAGPTSRTTGVSPLPVNLAMEGYCPVCIADMKKWVRGTTAFQSTFDGRAYLFPGQEQKTKFEANPTKYVPVLAGDCVVALKKMNKRVPGKVRFASFNNGRLFLFSNEMAQKEFVGNKAAYTNIDLALGGKCSVCRVEMQKDVEGVPGVSVLYRGMRYYFPGEEQRKMFVSNPAKYAVSTSARPTAGSGTTGSGTTGSGTTGSTTKSGSGSKGPTQGSSGR